VCNGVLVARQCSAMRPWVPGLLVTAACACAKSSGSSPDMRPEPYAAAVASLNAAHPRTLAELDRAMGTPASACDLANATCVCTWRFVTGGGAEEIVATASFADARTAEPETVPMVSRGNTPVELPPEEAERGFRAGAYNAARDDWLPVSTAGGDIRIVPSEALTELLNAGGHLVSRRAFKAAELEKKYSTWTARERLEACISQPGPVVEVRLGGKAVSW
jgi:hypothetical protein